MAGLAFGVLAGGTVPETLFPAARPVVFAVIFLSFGLTGETIAFFRGTAVKATVPDQRPADGRVDLAEIAGALRRPNTSDPRFGAFLGLDEEYQAFATLLPRKSPPLLGRVVIASLFVGKDGRGWSDAEVADAYAAITRAAEWIEAEAIRYGAAVNLELADTYFVFEDDTDDPVALGFQAEGDDVGPFEENATTKALVSAARAALALGFRDAVDLFGSIARAVKADTTVWLLHPRRSGRSFAVPLEDSALGGVSLAVCYPREGSFPEPLIGPARADPVTVAHELLHLFGASDKYGRPLRDFAPRSVSSREVMRLSESRLSRLRVDPFTAAEIGWSRGPENETAGARPEG